MKPEGLTRRELLRTAGIAGAALWAGAVFSGCSSKAAEPAGVRFRPRPHPAAEEWKGRIGLARGGDDPARNVRIAIEKLCGRDGARTFIKSGDVVAVKPNIGWGETPEMAATTTPEVVAAVVRLCLEAGAAKVKVFDNTITDAAKCYDLSGIEAAARQAGAEVVIGEPARFPILKFADPRVRSLTEWPIYADALTADILINVAIAKIHPLAHVSLCMKNLMGIQGGDRSRMHAALDQNLADLACVIRPTLNIVDATRAQVGGIPGSAHKENVAAPRIIVCGTSPVTVDAWAADPGNLPWPRGHHELADVGCIQRGAEAGLGVADPAKIVVAA